MRKKYLKTCLVKLWNTQPWAFFPLLPLSALFYLCMSIRKYILQKNAYHATCPVIVVGNVTVGGSGKTTFVIALIQYFIKQGYRVGVVSRGYGRQYPSSTLLVDHDMSTDLIGDEARMIWLATQIPICLSRSRSHAARILVQRGVNLIISDDGLQHYTLARTIEIGMLGSARSFGNGLLLPLGPLREPRSRLFKCDFIVNLAFEHRQIQPEPHTTMSYSIDSIESVYLKKKFTLSEWPLDKTIHAACAIGNPDGFFTLLQNADFTITTHTYPDHEVIDFSDIDNKKPIFITTKDAVKISPESAPENLYVVHIKPEFSQNIFSDIANLVAHRFSQVIALV